MIPPRFLPGRKVSVLDEYGNITSTSVVCVHTDKDELHRYKLAGLELPRFQKDLFLDYPSALTERERRAKTKEGSLQP